MLRGSLKVRFLSTSAVKPARIYARGKGLYGALGLGESLEDALTFTEVKLPNEDDVPVKVSAGWAHSVIVSEKGEAFVTGRPYDFNNILRLNRIDKVSQYLALLAAKASNSFIFGNVFGYYPVPMPLTGMPTIADVTTSAGLTIFKTNEGELFSFGFNRWEQCGIPSPKKDIIEQPQHILGLPSCSKVVAGLQHVVALSTSGQVIGWGKCNQGQLGFGEVTTTHNAPVQILINEKVVDISAGFFHNAAVGDSGAIYVWGKGMSDTVQTKMRVLQVADTAWHPRKVLLPNELKAVEVHCSNFTVMIRAQDNSLWVMGMGEHDRNANPHPVRVVSDYVALDDPSQSVLDNKNYVLFKGQQRMSIHTQQDYVMSPQLHTKSEEITTLPDAMTDHEQERFSSFEVVLHKGEAYLHPLRTTRLQGNDEVCVDKVLDFSSGWKHEYMIAR